MATAGRPAAPKVPAVLVPHDGGTLEAERDYEGVAFTGLDLTGRHAPGVRLLGCALTGCVLGDGQLPKLAMRDVTAEGLRAVGADLSESSWVDVVVSDSLLAGTQVFDATLRRVTFRDCKLDAANFRGATLTGVRFERCRLHDTDFGGATLQHCAFPGSQLLAADLSAATMDSVDLRDCRVEIARGYEALRGATIDSAQLVTLAPALARHLGIIVSDEHLE